MRYEWEPIAKERENEWMHLASEMLQGTIFEYFPEKDYMVCTRYEQDGYHYEKRITDYYKLLQDRVHPEDMGELYRVEEHIRREKDRIYAEMRYCFDENNSGNYQLSAIQGYRVYDGKMGIYKIIGHMYRMEEQWREKQQYYESKRDTMTYLWNHKYTREYIQDYLSQDGREELHGREAFHGKEEFHGRKTFQGNRGAFFIIDIDNFKNINDSMGRLFGDHVILSVAKVLRNIFKSKDIIGRMGGDEFVVFMKMEHTNSMEQAFSMEQANSILIRQKCDDICSAVSKIYCGERICNVSASVGVSRFPEDGQSYDEIFEKADKALYYTRRTGSNSYAVYEAAIAMMPFGGRELERNLELRAEQREETYNSFYNEISELTFRLLGDTTDADSAIRLLLHKLKDHFGFDAINIQEVDRERPRTMRYIYEVREDSLPVRQDTDRQYTEAEWMTMLYAMERGRYLYDRGAGMDLFFSEGKISSALRIPLGNKKYLTGVVDFVYMFKKHRWEENDVRFLESFSRILSVYLTRVRELDEANYLATMMQERDSVTGLYSYDKFLERMKEIISIKSEKAGILYVYSDISHFKYINETYGYDVGDLVLRKFAEFLLESGNTEMLCVSRVHSDNLVMAIRNTWEMTVEQLADVVDDQNASAAQVLRQYVHDNMISIRSGIFLDSGRELSVEEAVSNAAYACKESKKRSWHKCMIFSDELMNEYKKQLTFLGELQGAIENRELMVYIQPKMHGDGKTVAGGEALIRWRKANNEMIYPGEFIPYFEKSGAIVDVDFFVYREMFSYLRNRLDAGLHVVPISMNVSRVHLNNGQMIEYVKKLFEEYQVPPSLIEFELTENIYIENLDKAVWLINQLRDMGVKVSMDDFGSGYSSLNMLNNMPIDIMKIDRIFLKKDGIKKNDRIILRCIVYMARELDMRVVCEGVETKEQFEFLQGIGCDMMQGYYFGKPMPIESFNQFLEKRG